MSIKGKKLIIGILILIAIVILSEIYTASMSLFWGTIINVVGYTWNKLWWLIIILIVGVSIKAKKEP